jgi:hypothetical protein
VVLHGESDIVHLAMVGRPAQLMAALVTFASPVARSACRLREPSERRVLPNPLAVHLAVGNISTGMPSSR